MLVFPHVFQGGVWNMTLGKIASIELTSVPDMIFEAVRFPHEPSCIYHIGNIYRSQMPEDAFLKVTRGIRDKLFLINFI